MRMIVIRSHGHSVAAGLLPGSVSPTLSFHKPSSLGTVRQGKINHENLDISSALLQIVHLSGCFNRIDPNSFPASLFRSNPNDLNEIATQAYQVSIIRDLVSIYFYKRGSFLKGLTTLSSFRSIPFDTNHWYNFSEFLQEQSIV